MAPFEAPSCPFLLYRQPIERDESGKICDHPRTLLLLMHNLKRKHPPIVDFLIQTMSLPDQARVIRIRQWLNDHRGEIQDLPCLENLNLANPRSIPPLPPEAILLNSLSPLHKASVLASFLYHKDEQYARGALLAPNFIRPEHKLGSLILAVCYSNNVQLFRVLRQLIQEQDLVIPEDFHEHLAFLLSTEISSRWIALYEELSDIPQLMDIERFGSFIDTFLFLNNPDRTLYDSIDKSVVVTQSRDRSGNPVFVLGLNPATQRGE